MGRLGRKGQFGLVDAVSIILYFVAVLVIILLLNIAGCLIKNKETNAAIEADVSLAASVKADAQLNSYLRTKMPDKAELDAKLDWFQDKRDKNFVFALNLFGKNDIGTAKSFLNDYQEVLVGKDYSGFVSSLHAIYVNNPKERDKVKVAFNAVTAAMFLRSVKDERKVLGYLFYLLPIGVDFENAEKGLPSRGESLCQLPHYELCTQFTPYEIVPQRIPVQAVQVIPLSDGSLAKVELKYYPEFLTWLPEP